MFRKLSLLLSDYWVNYFFFIFRHGYIPNFKEPRSLSEKINYIKLYNRNPLRARVTDRLWVRDYVKKKDGDLKFTEILWFGEELSRAVWDALPEKFVLKANHGSQMVRVIVKSDFSFEGVEVLCREWMSRNYAQYGREWFYYNQKKYLIAESFLDFNGDVPPDYKFFCLNGKVGLVQVDLDRFSGHRRNLYDRDFNRLDAVLRYPGGQDVDKPKYFDRAVQIAEKLSVDFDFIRVDLYLLDDGVYFGELTNAPEGGSGRITPRSFDFKLGSNLPKYIER